MSGPSTSKPGINKASTYGPTLNDILQKLNNVRYLSLIDASSRYHSLRLDKKSSYLTIFACLVGRCRYTRLPLGVAPAGDIFQQKIDEVFNDMPNVFGIANYNVVVECEDDDRDHGKMVQSVLQRCREVSLKLNKDKCHFRCTSVPFFRDVISRNGVQQYMQKNQSPHGYATL